MCRTHHRLNNREPGTNPQTHKGAFHQRTMQTLKNVIFCCYLEEIRATNHILHPSSTWRLSTQALRTRRASSGTLGGFIYHVVRRFIQYFIIALEKKLDSWVFFLGFMTLIFCSDGGLCFPKSKQYEVKTHGEMDRNQKWPAVLSLSSGYIAFVFFIYLLNHWLQYMIGGEVRIRSSLWKKNSGYKVLDGAVWLKGEKIDEINNF